MVTLVRQKNIRHVFPFKENGPGFFWIKRASWFKKYGEGTSQLVHIYKFLAKLHKQQ